MLFRSCGDTAAEEALYLSRIAKKVHLLHRRNALRANKMLESRVRIEPRIELVWNTVIREIKGNGKVVEAVSWENVENGKRGELPVEGVFIFIGYEPNNKLIPAGVQVNELGFVMTDAKCETTVPGIFAVGDVRQKFANQIIIAAADGCIGALAAAHYVEMQKAGVPQV